MDMKTEGSFVKGDGSFGVAPPACGGADKIAAYNWARLGGMKGKAMNVPVDRLRVDTRYQRKLAPEAARRIAAQFDWRFFQRPTVNLRPDGYYYVLDGLRRCLAVKMRGDISSVPCVVLELDTFADEAACFYAINVYRGPVQGADKFRAAVAAKHPDALRVVEVCNRYGIIIDARKSDARPLHMRCGIWAMRNVGDFEDLVDFVVHVWPEHEQHLGMDVLSGVLGFARKLRTLDLCLADSEVRKKLQFTSLTNVIQEGGSYHLHQRGRKAAGIASALCDMWNKGRRSRKLEVKSAS